MPDLSFTYGDRQNFAEINREIERCRGERDKTCRYPWESFSALGARAFRVVRRYVEYRKLIVVTHGVLMRQFVYRDEIPYCGILEMQFDENAVCTGYAEQTG
jgi:hypothetical protein